MCGIAGFNASPAWVKSHIDEATQFTILEQAWLHNQHRGRDAAGYFRVDAETHELYTRKAPVPAYEILEDNKAERVLSPALVFGAHTRQATLGDPKDKRNNHPVEYENLIVTHNGTISNHNQYKNSVPINAKAQVGEVDTNAINIALNRLDNPYNMEEIKNQLKGLNGSMAIHAVWKTIPGVSLFARGKSSPLLMRFHPDGFFAYASVDDALYNMILAMGMDPSDPAWETREMEEYAFVVVESGLPILWGSYESSGWQPALNQLKYFVQRIVIGKKQYTHESDNKSHWSAERVDRSLKAARKAKKTDLIYSGKQGFIERKSKVKYPVVATLKPWDKISEADLVYENKDANILYAKYGDIEVIIDSDNSKLLDVFNHAKNPDVRRFAERPKRKDVAVDATFEAWLEDATRVMRNPIKKKNDYLYKRHNHANPIMGGRKTKKASSAPVKIYDNRGTAIQQAQNGETVQGGQDTFEVDVIDLGMEVHWANLDTYSQSRYEPMAFLNNIQCKEHNELYTNHVLPATCDATVLASIAFASCMTDITLWYRIDPTLELVTRKSKSIVEGKEVTYMCSDKKGAACSWEQYLHRQVFIGSNDAGYDQVVEVLMGEMCSKCGSKMFIRKLPDYMEWWTGDKRYVS